MRNEGVRRQITKKKWLSAKVLCDNKSWTFDWVTLSSFPLYSQAGLGNLINGKLYQNDDLASVYGPQREEGTVRGLRVWQWRSIGRNLTATAAGGSRALLHIPMADILPQETIANLNGKQHGCCFRTALPFRCLKVLIQPTVYFTFSLTCSFILVLYPQMNKKYVLLIPSFLIWGPDVFTE